VTRALSRTPPRLAIGLPQQVGKRMPLIPVDEIFKYAPEHIVRDKCWYWAMHIRASVGLSLIFWWYIHQPFAGANYHDIWESPRFRIAKAKLVNSGQLEENLRIKRINFYSDEPEEEIENWRVMYDKGLW